MGEINESESEKDVRGQNSLLNLRKSFNNYNVRRLLPSSTFRKEVPTGTSTQSESRPLIVTERLRVSAVPRMSGISEQVISGKNVTPNSLSQLSNFSPQQSPIEKQNYLVMPRHIQNRRSSTRSTGIDSGHGSLTSSIPSCRL